VNDVQTLAFIAGGLAIGSLVRRFIGWIIVAIIFMDEDCDGE
jgi:hypothetical protein